MRWQLRLSRRSEAAARSAASAALGLPDLAEVENLAARGLTMAQIASVYGVSLRTSFNRKNQSLEFAAAIKRGAAKGVAAVANRLFEDATRGNTVAQIFFLKCRGGWREYYNVEVTGADGGPIEIDDARRAYAESYEKRVARVRELMFALKESDGLRELDEELGAQAAADASASLPASPPDYPVPTRAFLAVLPGGLPRKPKPDGGEK